MHEESSAEDSATRVSLSRRDSILPGGGGVRASGGVGLRLFKFIQTTMPPLKAPYRRLALKRIVEAVYRSNGKRGRGCRAGIRQASLHRQRLHLGRAAFAGPAPIEEDLAFKRSCVGVTVAHSNTADWAN